MLLLVFRPQFTLLDIFGAWILLGSAACKPILNPSFLQFISSNTCRKQSQPEKLKPAVYLDLHIIFL